MSTPVTVYCLDENSKNYNYDEKLSDYLTKVYNNHNIRIEFHQQDQLAIDGGYSGNRDDFVYNVKFRNHRFDKQGNYSLQLFLQVIQDRYKGV